MLAWMGLLGLGALDELTQPLVRRSAGWDDFLANAAGAIVGLLLARTLLRMTPRKGDGSA